MLDLIARDLVHRRPAWRETTPECRPVPSARRLKKWVRPSSSRLSMPWSMLSSVTASASLCWPQLVGDLLQLLLVVEQRLRAQLLGLARHHHLAHLAAARASRVRPSRATNSSAITPIVVSALLPAAIMRRPSGVSVSTTKANAADEVEGGHRQRAGRNPRQHEGEQRLRLQVRRRIETACRPRPMRRRTRPRPDAPPTAAVVAAAPATVCARRSSRADDEPHAQAEQHDAEPDSEGGGAGRLPEGAEHQRRDRRLAGDGRPAVGVVQVQPLVQQRRLDACGVDAGGGHGRRGRTSVG